MGAPVVKWSHVNTENNAAKINKASSFPRCRGILNVPADEKMLDAYGRVYPVKVEHFTYDKFQADATLSSGTPDRRGTPKQLLKKDRLGGGCPPDETSGTGTGPFQSRSASTIFSPAGHSRSFPSLVMVYFWPFFLPVAWHIQ